MKKALLLTVLISQIGNLIYGQQGKDGAKVISTTVTVNEFTSLTANASAGNTFVTVTSSNLNSNGRFTSGLSSGDLIMIIQMQGSTIKGNVNDSTWGEILNYNNAGLYEFAEVINVPNASTINLRCPLQNSYTAAGKTQVIRVPRFITLTINNGGVLTTAAWNGIVGGVAVAEVLTSTVINAGGKIDVTGLGFRGGAFQSTGFINNIKTFFSTTSNEGGQKGESIAGYQTDYLIYGGMYGRGAPANGGGGGNSVNASAGGGGNAGNNVWTGNGNPDLSTPAWASAWNLEYNGFATSVSSGGGRGGYGLGDTDSDALVSGPGNPAWILVSAGFDDRQNVGGKGGRPLDYSSGRIFLGGGGGGGHQNDAAGGAGGNGGGLVYLYSYGTISGAGDIVTNGTNGQSSPTFRGTPGDGLGGGGAGGTVILNSSGAINGISVNANGGVGGSQLCKAGALESEGGAGGGGGGYIAISNGVINRFTNGGINGTTNSSALTEFIPNGATKGGAGINNASIVNPVFNLTSSNVSICLGTSANLTAAITGNSPLGTTLYWYNSFVNGNVIGTGNSFTTPVLNTVGTYTYYVGSCPGSQVIPVSVTVTPTPAVVVPIYTDVSCDGEANGSALGAVIGGTSPYLYSWNNSASTLLASGLTAGIYQVTVTDVNGCSGNTSITITEPPSLVVNIPIFSDLKCYNDGSGFISASAIGGTNPYTFNWSNASTNSSISNLSAGSYSLTVSDANNCISSIAISITEPTQLLAAVISKQDESCSGKNDGAINAASNGGTPGYNYLWSNGNTTLPASNLTSGIYSLTVTDANNCSAITQSTVSAAIALTSTVVATDVSCFGGSDGTASIVVNGGTPAYNYSWNNNNISSAVSNVLAGLYSVTVSDANSCSISVSVSISQPSQLILMQSSSATICNGQSYSITSSASGGSPGYLYNWSSGQLSQNISVSPMQQTIYTVTVTDSHNCIVVGSLTVAVNELPIVSFIADKREGCEPTCINFTNTTLNTQAATWQFSPMSIQNGNVVNECYNSAGLYNVTLVITDNNGCSNSLTEDDYITIHPKPLAAFSTSPQPTTILNSTINFTNLSQGYTKSNWSFGDVPNSGSIEQNPSYTYNVSGEYSVRLIVENEFGCADTANELVKIDPDFSLFAPNTFTPNDDGKNDNFKPLIVGMEVSEYQLLIFDRWGQIIFSNNNYSIGWDGRANGGDTIAQQDVYVYKIICKDVLGIKHRIVGNINLIR